MTVCYFGTYNPKYPRNRVLIEGLRRNGVKVIECNSRRPWILKYISLVFQFLLKARKVDAVVVGFPMGRGVVQLLKMLNGDFGSGRDDFLRAKLARRHSLRQLSSKIARSLTSVLCPISKTIVIDGFVSQYDAEVFDRKHLKGETFRARKLFQREQKNFQSAPVVLVDTRANAEYYSTLFSIPRDHFAVVPVGTDEELFHPQTSEHNDVIVHFSGTYNPLQGVDVIIRAIHIMRNESIRFRLVGDGEECKRIISLAKELDVYDRIEFIGRVPYDEYAQLTRDADVCLGIFSGSPKARRVIPNKVVEAMACGKAIITADTPAVRELLTNGENVRLCRPGDSNDLAEKILELYRDEQLRAKLGENARKVFLETLAAEKIGKKLLEVLKRVIQS